jgi:tetratricopeptide (TPR) repeat protein
MPEPHIGMGHVRMRRREFDAALESFSEARDLYSVIGGDLFELRADRYNRARMEVAEIEQRKAEIQLQIERAQSGSSTPQQNQTVRYLQSRLAEYESREMQLRMIDLPPLDEADPVPGEIHFFLGNALLNLGRTEEAIAAWETCAGKSPSFSLVHNNLAVGYWRLGRLDRARDSLLRAEQLGFPVNSQFKVELMGEIARRDRETSGAGDESTAE